MSKIQHIELAKSTHLYVWTLTETRDELHALCVKLGIDTSRSNGVKSERRAKEILAEYILIQHIFGNDAQLAHTDEGKPYIEGANHCISISHSEDAIAIATNETCVIGIDLEKPSEQILRVRQKFLNDNEQGFIHKDDLRMSLMAWTAKEAIYKAASTKGINFKEDIRLKDFSDTDNATYEGYFMLDGTVTTYELHSTPLGNAIITLAIRRQ